MVSASQPRSRCDDRKGRSLDRPRRAARGHRAGANGQLVAFRRLEPERYLPAAVRIRDLDGERVLVTSGLKEGDQIIIEGAPLVNQIR